MQHYFTSKDEMPLFAIRTISERVDSRMARRWRALGDTPSPRALLRAMLGEMLPLSAPAKAEAPVLAAFLARAVVRPGLTESQDADAWRLREFVAAQIGATQGDPTLEAAGLLAMVDGMMTQLLTGHTDERTALATLEYHLDRIFA